MIKPEIVPTETARAERVEHEWKPPEIGSWWWYTHETYDHDQEKSVTKRALVCVTDLGSNFAELTSPHRWHWKVHFDEFDKVCEAEPDPQRYINLKIAHHTERVRELMNEIQRVTTRLGVVPHDALSATAETSQALSTVSGTANVAAHKKALIKAKEKTLPELFEKVEEQHKQMAIWMKAELLPAKAQLTRMKQSIALVEDRIFTVELYAGLVEEVEQIADGDPAHNDEPIHLFQRRHYMDEECLINYQAGGMRFKGIDAFDKWICKPVNRDRLLPKPRCVVAFKVRRNAVAYDGGDSLSAFIQFQFEDKLDKLTFLYIRNGDQVFRMSTAIEFGSELFPDVAHEDLINGSIEWIQLDHFNAKPATQRDYDAAWKYYAKRRSVLATALWAWKRAGKPSGAWQVDDRYVECLMHFDPDHAQAIRDGRWGRSKYHGHPGHFPFGEEVRPPKFERFNQDSIHYDKIDAQIRQATRDHNRIAVVLQGLLDRSPVFHPHPPYQLWTPEGFSRAFRLVYDQSRAITDGDAPDFEAYRARVNKHIKPGSMVVGQQDAWERAEAVKENERRRNDWRRSRSGYDRELKHYRPRGNPGPGLIAKVVKVDRKQRLVFEWYRDRKRHDSWYSDGKYHTTFTCDPSAVLNISAYTKGDFKQFFDDPRTRAQYLKWAPLLLAAEDYVNGKSSSDTDDE